MTSDAKDICDGEPIEVNVVTASGERLPSKVAGGVRIQVKADDASRTVTLGETLLVPGLAQKLISIPKLDALGYKVVFQSGRVHVSTSSGTLVCTGTRAGNLFYLDTEQDFC
jgi:hypothetical protein